MTSECRTFGDIKHNCASSSKPTKKPHHEELENHQKKTEKHSQNKSTDGKEKNRTSSLQNQLQSRNQECQHLKTQVAKLQRDLAKKVARNKRERSTSTSTSNQTEACMTDIIVEKSRMLKNQELQIQALTQQVNSLKEVINITKDMLDIRNIEVKQLNDKLHCMDIKFGAEKDRHQLVHSKLERMVTLNTELKNEYKKQLCLFSQLQKSYHEHIANCKNPAKQKPSNIRSDITKNENKVILVKQPQNEYLDGIETPFEIPSDVSFIAKETLKQDESDYIIKQHSLKENEHSQDDSKIVKEAKGDTESVNASRNFNECPETESNDKQLNNENQNNENNIKEHLSEK